LNLLSRAHGASLHDYADGFSSQIIVMVEYTETAAENARIFLVVFWGVGLEGGGVGGGSAHIFLKLVLYLVY
jgi:hypothetical protein